MTAPALPRLVSASRRTDIPAFHSDWLLSRLEAGEVLVSNPFNALQVRRVSLAPADVASLVFWTRDFSPLYAHRALLDSRGYRYSILWTLTGYPRALEPGALPLEAALHAFRETASHVGPDRIAWRYDPIVITRDLTPSWHRENFHALSEALRGYTHRVIVSFMTPYAFVIRRLQAARLAAEADPLAREDVQAMAGELARLGAASGMTVQACCHGGLTAPYGLPDGACLDTGWLGLDLPRTRDKGQRKSCLCARSVDIGAYDTCPRGCVYCYATRSRGTRSIPGAS